MSDLSKRLRGRVHDSQMDNEYMMDEAADELDAKDAIIAELRDALTAALDRMEGEYGMAGEHMDKGYAALSKASQD